MNKNLMFIGLLSLVVLTACTQEQPQPSDQQQLMVVDSADHTPDMIIEDNSEENQYSEEQQSSEVMSNIKEIDMIAKQWDFEPSTITVNEGDLVKLNINNIDVPHGISIFEFGVNERLPKGMTQVEFTADKAGEYTFYCSVPCGKGHSGMKGTLIVE